ncbi:hypothetical protein AG1IA_06000 [Rhizoctonia solani AG-1 IA]|uniref:Uncharacterized protein n=1 Tax=Thanatephorus cucumeris (strain AG1-IA) TaxID=983506 RepID=L8WUE3_THACA|nr:hypothetical protein AG1IA_06000 [Rhizoctonia solani AG-1 IA]
MLGKFISPIGPANLLYEEPRKHRRAPEPSVRERSRRPMLLKISTLGYPLGSGLQKVIFEDFGLSGKCLAERLKRTCLNSLHGPPPIPGGCSSQPIVWLATKYHNPGSSHFPKRLFVKSGQDQNFPAWSMVWIWWLPSPQLTTRRRGRTSRFIDECDEPIYQQYTRHPCRTRLRPARLGLGLWDQRQLPSLGLKEAYVVIDIIGCYHNGVLENPITGQPSKNAICMIIPDNSYILDILDVFPAAHLSLILTVYWAVIAATRYVVTGNHAALNPQRYPNLAPIDQALNAPQMTLYKRQALGPQTGKIVGELKDDICGWISVNQANSCFVGVGIPGKRVVDHKYLPDDFLRIDYVMINYRLAPRNDPAYDKSKKEFDRQVAEYRRTKGNLGIHFNAHYVQGGSIVDSDAHPAFAAYIQNDLNNQRPEELEAEYNGYVQRMQRYGAGAIWDKWRSGATF